MAAGILCAAWVESSAHVAWTDSEGVVCDYQFGADLAGTGPALRQLRVPGGPLLTGSPGVTWSWSTINGFRYDAAPAVAGTGQREAYGVVHAAAPKVEHLPDGGLIVRQQIDYRTPTGRLDLAEYRDLVFTPIGRNGKYAIDWTSHFTAGEAGARLLDSVAGGSGLAVTLATDDAPVQFVVLPPARADLASVAAPVPGEYSQAVAAGLYPGQRHPGSIAVLADPRNTVGSQCWRLDGFESRPPAPRRMVALLLPGGEHWLEPGEVWEVSYRIVVRPKRWDAEDLQAELFRWLSR